MLHLPTSQRNWPLVGDQFAVRWVMTIIMRCWLWADAKTRKETLEHPFNRVDGVWTWWKPSIPPVSCKPSTGLD